MWLWLFLWFVWLLHFGITKTICLTTATFKFEIWGLTVDKFTTFTFFSDSYQQQENAIQTMELRNYFSLFCLHQETQLIFIYLPITSHILGAFVNSQVQGHREVRPNVWKWLWKKKDTVSFMLAEGANKDGAHHSEDHQGFCIVTESLPHALALQLKYLF